MNTKENCTILFYLLYNRVFSLFFFLNMIMTVIYYYFNDIFVYFQNDIFVFVRQLVGGDVTSRNIGDVTSRNIGEGRLSASGGFYVSVNKL